MRQSHSGHIDLGDGGLILNTEANEHLLHQLRETPPLSQTQLLKLAKYFKGFPTQISLGNHLALLALTTPEMQVPLLSDYFDPADFLEDLIDGQGNNAAHERGETDPTGFLSVRHVSVSGIGLLIETIVYNDGKTTRTGNFVVGVSPDPDKLPHA